MRFWRSWRGLILSVLVFALVLGGVWALVAKMGDQSGARQSELVRDAVRRAVTTCFAIEGRYPPSVDYLVEHYGLKYNEDRYIISYDAFASNVMPDVRVLTIGGDAG